MMEEKTSARQIKDLLSGLAEHGSQHLAEAETDLIQTNILLREAIAKLGASFMAIHGAIVLQQQMVEEALACAAVPADAVEALRAQSGQIGLHVNSAITGLQFQDMTNQLISRTMRRIAGLRDVLLLVGEEGDMIPVETDASHMQVLLDKITETMRAQSTVLEKELWKAVCQTHMESGDIELF